MKALQCLTGWMAEAFGLDRKIENYKGIRPLTLYRWDLECLMDVIDLALKRLEDRIAVVAQNPILLLSRAWPSGCIKTHDAVYSHRENRGPEG